jgi:hypothetical protein
MTAPVRLLLDQGFPVPPPGMRIDVLDRTVSYEHFSIVARDYAKVSTPDWMVYLLAKDLGFAALVTSDHSQLEQDEELVTLALTDPSLITWKGRQEDAVVMWGQLLAFMPQILPKLGPQMVIRLPSARLSARDHVCKVSDLARQRKVSDGISWEERKGHALRTMRHELSRRGAERLAEHLRGASQG